MAPEQDIIASRIKFADDGKEVDGYQARPAKGTPSAAIIVIHEWWGLNRHIEDVAERYARAGFVAAAPDLYDGVTTRDPQEASKLMSSLDQEKAIGYLKTVTSYLRATGGVQAVGVTGFCMGGTFALLLPCHAKLDAAVPFYGDVPADLSILEQLSCPVLFIGGEKDEWITVEKMKRLEAAFKQYKKDGEVRIYEEAPHAFFNDTRPDVYRASDAEDAWLRAIDFFNRHLRKGLSAGA